MRAKGPLNHTAVRPVADINSDYLALLNTLSIEFVNLGQEGVQLRDEVGVEVLQWLLSHGFGDEVERREKGGSEFH